MPPDAPLLRPRPFLRTRVLLVFTASLLVCGIALAVVYREGAGSDFGVEMVESNSHNQDMKRILGQAAPQHLSRAKRVALIRHYLNQRAVRVKAAVQTDGFRGVAKPKFHSSDKTINGIMKLVRKASQRMHVHQMPKLVKKEENEEAKKYMKRAMLDRKLFQKYQAQLKKTHAAWLASNKLKKNPFRGMDLNKLFLKKGQKPTVKQVQMAEYLLSKMLDDNADVRDVVGNVLDKAHLAKHGDTLFNHPDEVHLGLHETRDRHRAKKMWKYLMDAGDSTKA